MPRYLPALLSLLSSIAYAQDDSILRIFCRPAEPWLYMTTMDTPQAKSLAGHALEPVDAGALVSYTPEDEKGDIYRSGSLSTDRKCGSLSIRISGGYYNANTQGQLGAKEDYPIVEITDGPKRFGPFAIGSCSASSERSSMMVACPQTGPPRLRFFNPRENRWRTLCMSMRTTWRHKAARGYVVLNISRCPVGAPVVPLLDARSGKAR